MNTLRLLILAFVVQCFAFSLLQAEESSRPPLQLAPGPGVQSATGQGALSPPLPAPGPNVMGGGEEEQLRDVHPPVPLPEEKEYTVISAVLLLGLLTLFFLFWFLRRRKNKIVLPLAHETALADLHNLRSLMSPDHALLYAKELSDVLRRYIEQRFRIRASRKTTKEFFAGLQENPNQAALLLEDHHDSLETCLECCDMAKFALCTPDMHGMERMEAAVREFIDATRQQREGVK